MRKTKIICTMGPSCADEATLTEMCLAGMNVARFNFSHGTHEGHGEHMRLVKRVREKLGLPVAILLDTKGPESRIGVFTDGKVLLREGDTFTFTAEPGEGNRERVHVDPEMMPCDLGVGDMILLNNGLLRFEVTALSGGDTVCRVVEGGELTNRKSMSFPGKTFDRPYLSEQDRADLMFGIENDIDFIACSFVSCRQDLLDVRELLDANGGRDVSIIAKIENQKGIDNIEEICEVCDGIMIGRGDLGVEVPFEELPAIQKALIDKCRLLGKRVITATEMLESMTNNPRPTRAEISDVANAIYDGTSAIMLSGETAAGKYPVLTLKTMAKIAEKAEESIPYHERFLSNKFKIKNAMDALSHSVCGLSMDVDAKAIAVCSLSGMTARMVSRFRSPVDILGLCVNEKTWRQLALSWGVTPVLCQVYPSMEVLFYRAEQIAKDTFGLCAGDTVIITGGSTTGTSGKTDTIRIATVG